jgi:hypothetical protein
VEGHTDSVNEYLINPCQPFIDGVIAELSGTNGEETTDSSKYTGFFGEFVIHKRGYGLEGNEPGSLDVIHDL